MVRCLVLTYEKCEWSVAWSLLTERGNGPLLGPYLRKGGMVRYLVLFTSRFGIYLREVRNGPLLGINYVQVWYLLLKIELWSEFFGAKVWVG